jgi:hypothetical protein
VKVLIACEFSGIVREAFKARGHDAWSCDLLDTEIPGKHIKADFRSVIQDTWDFVGYHYECRVMANSGVRWLHSVSGRWEELNRACKIFNLTLKDERPGYSENPIQHKYARERILRKYNQIIHPWQFGHTTTKATCLWLRELPNLIPTNIIPVEQRTHEIHLEPPGPERWKNRSRTFSGIARAMAEQWG